MRSFWECCACCACCLCCYRNDAVDYSADRHFLRSEDTDFEEEGSEYSLRPDELSERWRRRVQEFRVNLGRFFGRQEQGRQPSDDDIVFSLLLALYSGGRGGVDSALLVRDLNTMLRRDPDAVEFYLPQICTYLALHNFSPEAVPYVMAYTREGLCRRDLRLAHRVNWHLQAFCAASPHMDKMRAMVEEEGAVAASVLSSWLDKDELDGCHPGHHHLPSIREQTGAGGDLSLYHPCLYFIDALTKISQDLIAVDADKRDEILAAELERLNEYFLSPKASGSAMIYVPMGDKYHKVKRVVPSESVSFSTKERVPILVCLQVESYDLDDVILMPGRIHAGGQHQGEENEMAKVFESFRAQISQGIATVSERARRNMSHLRYVGRPDAESMAASIPLSPRIQQQQPEADMGQWSQMVSPGRNEGVVTRIRRALSDTFDTFGASNRDPLVSLGDEETGEGGLADPFPPQDHPLQSVGLQSSSFAKGDAGGVALDRPAGLRLENSQGGSKSSPLLMSPSHMRSSAWRPRSPSDHALDEGDAMNSSSDEDVGEDNDDDRRSDEADELEGAEDIDSDMGCSRVALKQSHEEPEHSDRILFTERWAEKEKRVEQEWMGKAAAAAAAAAERQQGSRKLPSKFRLIPLIVKANDDLRQEQAVSQLIRLFHRIFEDAKVRVWLKPYSILATGADCGIIEAVQDTVSLHALKRKVPGMSLDDFFKKHFRGEKGGVRRARENFCRSCAGYAIVCYLLQIKDRHNGNILLDSQGHLVHIDWGFVLGLSPGGNFGFETAPFKLTAEMVAVLGGPSSFTFQRFRRLCTQAFLEVRRQREKIIMLVEMLAEGNPELPCFSHAPTGVVIDALRARFLPNKTAGECVDFVASLIDSSRAAWTTHLYDTYQKWTVGVLS